MLEVSNMHELCLNVKKHQIGNKSGTRDGDKRGWGSALQIYKNYTLELKLIKYFYFVKYIIIFLI
jgi:hypothetical protein